MKTIYFFLLLALTFQSGIAQIVNIEQKRITTDTTGIAGSVNLSLAAGRYTQSFLTTNIGGHIQYKTIKNLYLLVGNYQVFNAGGTSFNNRAFGHIRYNRTLSKIIKFELFTQIQYNSLTKIKARYLNGAGLRFKLSPYENAKFYWGLALMNEYEILENPHITNRDNRLSSYLTFSLIPQKTIRLTNTSYVQPNLADFLDFRFSNNTTLSFDITEKLKFETFFDFLYDSRPPVDISSINYQVKNGLMYKF